MRRKSGHKVFVMLLSMTFLMLGGAPDGNGGGVIAGNPPCHRRVKVFAGWPFWGFLMAEQEADEDVIFKGNVTLVASSSPAPIQGAVTYLRNGPTTPVFSPDIKLADLTDEDIRRIIVGDPSTEPRTSLCFESFHTDQPGDPLFFLLEGAIRIHAVEGISAPRQVGTTTVRWAQVFGFVIPEAFLEE